VIGKTYLYQHPESLGLGGHHAAPGDPPLHERPAEPDEGKQALRATLEMVNPTEDQRAALEAYLGRTMHDLDMHHGTLVTHTATDEDTGSYIVGWTDAHGTTRSTSVDPGLFEQMFTLQAGGQAARR
jgi:hypothetical protein